MNLNPSSPLSSPPIITTTCCPHAWLLSTWFRHCQQSNEVIVSDDGRQTTAEEMIRERWVKWVANSKRGVAPNKTMELSMLKVSGWLSQMMIACQSQMARMLLQKPQRDRL